MIAFLRRGRPWGRPLSFPGRFFVLTAPLLFQDLLRMLFSNVDLIMISRTGEAQTAACGLVNSYLLIFYMVIFAFRFAMMPLSAQYYGAKRRETFESYASSGAFFLFWIGVICAIFFYYLLPSLLSMWGVSAEVQTAAIDYASVLAFGLPFFGVAVAFENALRVTSHTRMALISKLSTLFLNTVLNYLLIYGFWKIPALGIFGAGIATSAALFIECIIAAFFSFKLARIMRFSLASFVNFEKKIWTQTMKGVLPILPQEILWSGAVLVYSRAFAAFGTSVLANYNIARQIELFSESGCWAFMVSAGIVIGNDLGAGRLNRARIKAKAILSFGFFFSLLVSLLVWLLLPVSVWAYGLNPESYQLIRNFALLFLLITPLKMMALIILVGILRSGGDFLFSALSEISSMWLYSVPLALFCSLYAGFSPEIVFAVVCSEWFIKAFLLWWRYRKGLWLKNLVEAG